jgi:hypothetical protein
VSPILTRPVREQLEHDRVIRQLQARYKRKNEVIINPGHEQNQSVTVGELVVFPDLLLFSEGGRRLLGTVEVETAESVNAIEARAEWGVYSKLKVPLHLYVPPACVDAVKRICAEYQILISELWTYTSSFDQVRFNMVHRSADAPVVRMAAASPERTRPAKPEPNAAPAKAEPVKAKSPAKIAAKSTPKLAATLRQAQGRPEQSRGTKKTAPKPKVKSKPAAKKTAKKGRH